MYSKRVYGGVTRSGKPFKRAKTSVSQSDHQKLLRLQRVVSALKPELKYVQNAVALTNVSSSTGSIGYLSGCAQGTNFNQRIGNKVRAKWLNFGVEVFGWGGAGASGFRASVYIIKDKLNQGVLPTTVGAVPAILTSADPGVSFVNRGDPDRFVVLHKFNFTANSFLAGGPQSGVYQEKMLYLNDMPIEYEGTANTIGSAGKNALFCCIISNDTSDTVDFYTTAEICYSDI